MSDEIERSNCFWELSKIVHFTLSGVINKGLTNNNCIEILVSFPERSGFLDKINFIIW